MSILIWQSGLPIFVPLPIIGHYIQSTLSFESFNGYLQVIISNNAYQTQPIKYQQIAHIPVMNAFKAQVNVQCTSLHQIN